MTATGHLILTDNEYWLIARLAKAKGNFVTWDALIGAVWDDPDMEPDNPRNMVSVTLNRIKEKLRKRGMEALKIEGRWGYGLRLDIEAEPPARSDPIDL